MTIFMEYYVNSVNFKETLWRITKISQIIYISLLKSGEQFNVHDVPVTTLKSLSTTPVHQSTIIKQ